MPCCSEIAKDIKYSNNILDYIFKAVFVIFSLPLIAASFTLRQVLCPFNVFYSSLIFFDKKFIYDIYNEMKNLNSMKLNCRITSNLHMISPRLAGLVYRNFGYLFMIITGLCVALTGYFIWYLIH